MIFIFWLLNFKPAPSLSSFTFIKRIFSSSSLSAIRVVSSAYLTLSVFLPAFSASTCASYSPAFFVIYSAYKLNNQGDNMLPWCTPFPIWNKSIVPCLILTVASWSAYSFSRGQVSGLVFPFKKNFFFFSQFVVIYTSKGCSEIEVDIFSGILLLFLWSKVCW